MRVAFIGLGTMGSRMVANLLEHGHEVTVTDVRREAAGPALDQGATWADSPREAARDAELILSSLPGPREVEGVVLGDEGVINGAAPEAIYADLSTSSVSLARRIYAELKAKGVEITEEANEQMWGIQAQFKDPDANSYVIVGK